MDVLSPQIEMEVDDHPLELNKGRVSNGARAESVRNVSFVAYCLQTCSTTATAKTSGRWTTTAKSNVMFFFGDVRSLYL